MDISKDNKFLTSRPVMQSGLTDVIPLGQVPSHYLNRYRAVQKVRCAFCENHTPHNNGFTVQMKDGRTALCGKDCAEIYFGEAVAKDFEKSLEKQIKRETNRKIITKTLVGIPKTLTLLTDDLIEMEALAISATEPLAKNFQHSGIQTKTTDSGTYEHKEICRRWVDQQGMHGNLRKNALDEERIILKIKAASLLRGNDISRIARLKRAKKELKILQSVNLETDLSDVIIERISTKRKAIISDIENGIGFLDLCQQFYTKENIKALSKLNQHLQTNSKAFALHKRPYGFDLVISSNHYDLEHDFENPARATFQIPDLSQQPTVETLLAALKGEIL
tara:strand:+ start:15594 stop:16598 length:1005 start_codon:yes stop_codon:yes gene_type:complete